MSLAIDLEGRRALVTGAGQGVGRAIALSLAQAGAIVAINDVVAERADSVVAEIRAGGGQAVAATFAVTDRATVQAGIEAAGPLHILVNHAGHAGVQGYAGPGP